jgi:hypothetical protein
MQKKRSRHRIHAVAALGVSLIGNLLADVRTNLSGY